MEKKKTKLEQLAEEKLAEDLSSVETPLKGPKTSHEGTAIKKRTGRPKTKPDSRQISFHVPLELIPQIEAEALNITDGNKSSLLIKMIAFWFANKK